MQNPLYSPLRCLSTALGWRALGRLSDHCYLGYNRTSALPQSACLRLLPSTAAAGRNPQKYDNWATATYANFGPPYLRPAHLDRARARRAPLYISPATPGRRCTRLHRAVSAHGQLRSIDSPHKLVGRAVARRALPTRGVTPCPRCAATAPRGVVFCGAVVEDGPGARSMGAGCSPSARCAAALPWWTIPSTLSGRGRRWRTCVNGHCETAVACTAYIAVGIGCCDDTSGAPATETTLQHTGRLILQSTAPSCVPYVP